MIYYFSIVFSIIFIIFIINLVRKNKLDEKYSIVWMFSGIIILLVSLFPKIVSKVALQFDVYYPPALLLLFGILILGIYTVHLCVVVSKQNKILIKLAQEVAIIKQEIEKEEKSKEE